MRRIPYAFLAPALAAAFAVCAAAQSSPAALDAGHSYARLWMGLQTETSVMVNVGVAQVGGSVHLGARNPTASSLDFTLVPGGGGTQLLTPEGTLRSDVVAPILRYTAMIFRSAHARIRRDGRLEFSGELDVVHVTREQILPSWNSANNSPSYTDPKTSRSARTVTFVLASPRAQFLAPYLEKHSDIILSATIDAHSFPDLPGIILDSDWPAVAEDEHCEPVNPTVNLRDYSGWTCDGKAITKTAALQPAQTFGLDYSGPRRYNAPTDGPVTILLHLKLASAPATSPPAR